MRFVYCTLLLSVSASAQLMPGFDTALMKKWGAATVAQYVIVGEFKARDKVVFGDYEGKADITDRLTFEFTWDIKKHEPIGPIKVTETKTSVANIKSDGTNCPPPTLQGEYEHLQIVKPPTNRRDQLLFEVVRTYPAARVSNYPASCSMQQIPGGKVEERMSLAVIEGKQLSFPIPADQSKGGVTPDRKSFVSKAAGDWTWTYTPTIIR